MLSLASHELSARIWSVGNIVRAEVLPRVSKEHLYETRTDTTARSLRTESLRSEIPVQHVLQTVVRYARGI